MGTYIPQAATLSIYKWDDVSNQLRDTTLGILTNRMESQFPSGWRMTDIEPSEITRQLPSISGFELEIERIE